MYNKDYHEIYDLIESSKKEVDGQYVITNIGSFLDKVNLICKLSKSPDKYESYMNLIYTIYRDHYNCNTKNIERLDLLKAKLAQ